MLFSDVEGSTLLLTRLGRHYEQVLEGSRDLQRRAWADYDGVEMGTEGDSFFVVFAAADAAVRAAIAAQTALQHHPWPAGEPVRVRMGIHTGSPRIHGDGYVGIDVHRAARIAAAAHGGQVVLSEVTAKLVEALLPAMPPLGVGLRDLGRHRLKDLTVPEHLHQLLIPGAAAQFPPLKSLGTTSSLPSATTPLLGRQSDTERLATMLRAPGTRLVTLTGPGGSGKTRLAVAAARDVVDQFPDGVYFVPLAAVTSAHNIWGGIADTLDLPATTRTDVLAQMGSQRALVVLDNLEQIDRADTEVTTLLDHAPDVVVLATSRRPLHLASERQYAVEPLALPESDNITAVEASPAVQLFVERARAVRSSFRLAPDNAADIAAICGHLDGLPLAIELAAARSKLLGPRGLRARLDQALAQTLTHTTDRTTDLRIDSRNPQADRPTRQQALRETIDWSYRLLPPPQQALFRRLGVFAGGADLDAVAAVCGNRVPEDTRPGAASPDDTDDTADLVEALVDASLVGVTEDDDGDPRFTLLETLRAYALDALAHAGELDDTRLAHARHYASVAWRLRWFIIWTSREARLHANRLFDREQHNFREALTWLTTDPGSSSNSGSGRDAAERTSLALALLAGAGDEVWLDVDPVEWHHWLEVVLDRPETPPSVDRGICLFLYAEDLSMRGDQSRALAAAQRSVEMLTKLDAPDELAWALLILADVHAELGDLDQSRSLCDDVARRSRARGNGFLLANALRFVAFYEMDLERWDEALRLLNEAHRAFTDSGWSYLPNHSFFVGRTLRKLGRAKDAHQLMSTELHQEARGMPPLGLVERGEDYAAALADAGFAQFTPLVLAACQRTRTRIGATPARREQLVIDDARKTAQAALPPEQWSATWARGEAMALPDALAEAILATAGLTM